MLVDPLYFKYGAPASTPVTNVSGRVIRQLPIPAITEPVIAIADGKVLGNSRFITVATKIAATGSTITK